MSLPRYPRYKASGLDWLGEVPANWGVSCLKYSVKEIFSGGTPETGNVRYWAETDVDSIPWVSIGDMTRAAVVETTEKHITQAGLASKRLRLLPTGTLLYSMYASLGKVAVLAKPAAINQAILGIVPDTEKLTQSFLRYWLIQIERHLPLFSSSNTQDNLNAGAVRSLPLLVPPQAEQTRIAEFLDQETAKIDGLVAEKRRLMELLKEKRQAVISHAVTRGLIPSVTLKPSGTPLGDVPAQWHILRLKHISPRISGRLVYQPAQYFGAEGVPFLMGNNVTERGIVWDDVKLIPEAINNEFSHHALREGDVVTVRVGAPGVTCVVPKEAEGLNCGSLMIIRRAASFDSQWLACVMNSPIVRRQIDSVQYGAAQEQINIRDAVNFLIPTPPLAEQITIVRHLEVETAKFDALTAEAQRAIELLQERRSALVSAAVTGQIDVQE